MCVYFVQHILSAVLRALENVPYGDCFPCSLRWKKPRRLREGSGRVPDATVLRAVLVDPQTLRPFSFHTCLALASGGRGQCCEEHGLPVASSPCPNVGTFRAGSCRLHLRAVPRTVGGDVPLLPAEVSWVVGHSLDLHPPDGSDSPRPPCPSKGMAQREPPAICLQQHRGTAESSLPYLA